MNKFITKYKNMSIAAKAALWYVFCNLMTKGISTITVPIFTRVLTIEEYGTYSIYLSWLNILTIVTSLNLYYGAYNNALNRYKDDKTRSEYISSMQGITTSLTIVLAIVYVADMEFWNRAIGLSTPIMCLMLIELAITPAMHFWTGRMRFEYRYRSMVLLTVLKSILNPVIGLILVFSWTKHHDVARIAGVVISEIIVSGSLMLIQFIRGRKFIDIRYWKYALAFNIPLLPHYLSGTILNQGDRIMIQKMIGKSEVAIYSIAYNIGMLIMLFTNAINNSMTPWMYEKLNKKDYDGIRKNLTYILGGIAVLIICLMFFAPEVVLIFGSTRYADAVYVVPPVAASVFFIFLFNVFAIPQMYFEDKKFLPISSIAAACLNIVLNAIFIRLFGYYAAGYTTLVCYVFYSIGHYYFSKKVCNRNIPEAVLFNAKHICIISAALITCAIIFNFLYRTTYIRYVFGTIILITILWQRKHIINTFKELKENNVWR